MVARKTSIGLLLAVTMLVIVAAALTPRIGQPQSYHTFADQRRWLGIQHFGDVVSNVPFAIVGIWGLWFLLRLTPEQTRVHFIDARERWPYVLVAGGLLLTAFGSGYYHLAPDNARLVWDRLPMTIVFMSLISAMIAERISVRAGLWLLPALLILGAASRRRDSRERVGRMELHAAGGLDERLDDNGRQLARMGLERALEVARRLVVGGQRHNELRRQHGSELPMHSFLGIADGHRREGVAVVAAAKAHESRAPRLAAIEAVLQRDFQRDFDGRRPVVRVEHPGEPLG